MRRRGFLLVAGAVALSGCRSGGDGTGESSGSSSTRSATATPGSGRTRGTPESTGTDESALQAAREPLTEAFDELRAMRPVGPERIRVSDARFRASDHERVRERVDAAETALDRAEAGRGADAGPLDSLRAAVELARSGLALYGAVRRGIRAEWRFEQRCFGAEWAEAREQARDASEAVSAWERHSRAVTQAVASVDGAGQVPIPRLSLRAWYRDGAVLGGVAGPWVDVLDGFGGFAEAVLLDEAGLAAMEADEHRTAGERFAAAADAVRDAHRRLARAKAAGAQGFASYATPIRRRCEPFRRAYATQVEAARAAVADETDRAERLDSRAMDRIVTAELEHPLPKPEGGTPEEGSDTGAGSTSEARSRPQEGRRSGAVDPR